MKNHSNILKYPIMLAVFILLMFVLDKLFGGKVDGGFWNGLIKGGAFAFAMFLADVAEKHDWDTWSGLIRKFRGMAGRKQNQ